MADQKTKDPTEDVEIEALSDEDLEDVAGGFLSKGSSDGCCSCSNCSQAP